MFPESKLLVILSTRVIACCVEPIEFNIICMAKLGVKHVYSYG